jgi:hypothetical protein
MNRIFTFLAFLLLFTTSSCHRYYTSSAFAEKTAKHKVIAVLPPQIIITGIQPKSLTQKDIALLEENESRLFQQALYNNILQRANNKRKPARIMLQPHNNTIALLQKNNISIREAWSRDDRELASLLGVDAVVRSSIQKERFMSDAASAGVEAGKRILDAVLKRPVLLPEVISKTNEIHATCALVSNGETLWNDSYKKASDHNYTANTIIENITDKFAKHFPYLKKS